MTAKLAMMVPAWCCIAMFLVRGGRGSRRTMVGIVAGFTLGAFAGASLVTTLSGNLPFSILKGAAGATLLLITLWSIAAFYRSAGVMPWLPRADRLAQSSSFAFACTFLAGALSVVRLIPQGGGIAIAALVAFLATAAGSLLAARYLERILPLPMKVTGDTLPALVVAVLLFIASAMPRLDLFSPLTMRVMKFIHDFVHQFFESMLIPDHPFFRPDVWEYIGLLFGNGVGFWGGLAIWFLPVLLIMAAVRMEPLPSVAHIRQGAQRRKLLARYLADRRLRMAVPAVAIVFLAGAVYQSRFPAVEYWDPKPLPVEALPSGEIVIPKKGEVDLEDGRIHKYVFRRGGQEATFFVLLTPSGHLAVTLDACAICKPDGYGQGEGAVICYYCKTLIPLDTVGKPGGCNPVPVAFAEKDGAVSIDAGRLLNAWQETVQATQRVRKGGE